MQVISARKGEFETGFERGGQTREHAMLAKTAGVKHLIVLINKMDDSTVEWSEDRYNECKEKLIPYLKKVCVAKSIKNKSILWNSSFNCTKIVCTYLLLTLKILYFESY